MKDVTKFLFTFLLLLSFFGCLKDENSDIKVVSPEEMESFLNIDEVQLVDVRTSDEFAEEFIPGSQNIDFASPTFEDDIEKLDKSKPVLLYCNTGTKSAGCAKKLIEAGFIKIYELEGGITKWKYKGGEVKHRS